MIAALFFDRVKLQDVYTDWRIVAGFALACLGAANWMIGLSRTQQYSQIINAASHVSLGTEYRSFDELDAGAGGAVLEPLTARQRQVSYATARMDFYHATFLMGRLLVLVGLLIGFWGFIAVIRTDTRRALRRASGPPPDAMRPG